MNFKAFKNSDGYFYTDVNDKHAPTTYYYTKYHYSGVRSSQSFPCMEIFSDDANQGARCSYLLEAKKSIDVISSEDASKERFTRVTFSFDRRVGNSLDIRSDRYGIINRDTNTMLFYDGINFIVRKLNQNGSISQQKVLEGNYAEAFKRIGFFYLPKAINHNGCLEPNKDESNYFEAKYGAGYGFSLNSWDECFRIGVGGGYFDSTTMWFQDGKAHAGLFSNGRKSDNFCVAIYKDLSKFSVGKLSASGLNMNGLVVIVGKEDVTIYSNKDNYGASNDSYVLEWNASTNKATIYYVDSNGDKVVDCEAIL